MLSPITASQWNFGAAAHLLVRAGFGVDPAGIENTFELGPDRAAASLLHAPVEDYPPPIWAQPDDQAELRAELQQAATPAKKQMAGKLHREQFISEMKDLTRWWIERMVNSASPFTEKMILLWHGHFATSAQKVRSPYKMWLQNETLRQNALGNFRTLVKAISRDPAMMIWLDTVQSKKESPNENFGREVKELFTLREGEYSETDVKAAARAFTGYRIDRADQSFRFAENFLELALRQMGGSLFPSKRQRLGRWKELD